MALPLPWLVAAVVSALAGGGAAWTPAPRWVDGMVARVVNDAARALAIRRGVHLTGPLPVQLLNRALLAEARAAADESRPGEQFGSQTAAARQAVLTHLGLWGPVTETRSGAARTGDTATGREVTGLYDLDHQRLLLANWADLASGRFAWTRDVALALLDRRFSLSRWLMNSDAPTGPLPPAASRPPAGSRPSASSSITIAARESGLDAVNSDAVLSRQALAQGDATVLALEALDPDAGLPSRRAMAGIAAQVRDSLVNETAEGTSPWALQTRLFIELEGLSFVVRLRGRLPWRAVDEAWRRPPVSSEQILHPEKYERDERPDEVGKRLALAMPPTTGWRVAFSDTLGEWGVRQFLGRAGDPYRSDRAAAGWGGDRVLLLEGAPVGASSATESSGDSFVAWVTTWDDETDASDFAAEAAQALAALAGVGPLVDDRPASGRLRLTDGSGRVFALDRRRRAVGLLVAAPAATGDLLARLTAAAASPGRVSRVSARGQGRARGGGSRPR